MEINEIEVTGKTVVRLVFDERSFRVGEMEILRIISESKNTLHLSNGITVARECLFPYHKRNYHRGEEYYFLDKIIF